MLGKLFKYEFKNTAKIMLTIYGVLIAVTVLGMLVLSFEPIRNGDTMAATLVLVSYILLYVLSVIALYVVTYIYLTMHFYKSMYSAQGYLTHTLPVKTLTTFHVKLATSLIWMLASTLLMFLSILGFASAISGPGFWQELFSCDFAAVNQEILSTFNMPLAELIIIVILSLIISSLASLLLVYASCSIGQLFNQHKVVAAVVTGIIFYFLQQIIGTIVSVAGMVSMMNHAKAANTSIMLSGYDTALWCGVGLSLFFVAAYYIVCNIIVRKKINLQ